MKKQVTIKIDEKTHKKAKLKAVMIDKNFSSYLEDVIKADLEKDKKEE